MVNQALDRAVYEKYIAPTCRPKTQNVGIELEFPVVNLSGGAVDFALVHRMTEAFASHFGFSDQKLDDEGAPYSAVCPENGDCLSFDCSYNTLELSFGKELDINVIFDRFQAYYSFVQERLLPEQHTLTGMGINPGWRVNARQPIPNGRYRMLLHHLSSYPEYGNIIPFHRHPDFGLFACASQVQLDVEAGDIIPTLHAFSRLEPFKSLLFANSYFDADGGWLLARDWFWRESVHGLNRKNVDFYDEKIQTLPELTDYIGQTSIFCAERDGRYLNFRPTPVEEYVSMDSIRGTYYENGGYHTMEFQPQLRDLAYLRSYKLEDLTYRGTIEYRSVCQQPVNQVMAAAAFHAGLAEELGAVRDFLAADHALYGHGRTMAELRDQINRRGLPTWADKAAVAKALLELLELARSGLLKRGSGEERFLEPLYARAEQVLSPAQELADALHSGVTMNTMIRKYAELSGF